MARGGGQRSDQPQTQNHHAGQGRGFVSWATNQLRGSRTTSAPASRTSLLYSPRGGGMGGRRGLSAGLTATVGGTLWDALKVIDGSSCGARRSGYGPRVAMVPAKRASIAACG